MASTFQSLRHRNFRLFFIGQSISNSGNWLTSSALTLLALLVLSASPNVTAAVVVAFFVGMASILYTTSTTALVQVRARPDMHGRLLAIQTIFLVGSSAVGGPISGWVADAFGRGR